MQKTALLIIDAQNEMLAGANPVFNKEELLENLQYLIEKARSADIPVVFVQHNDKALVAGTYDWQIHRSIRPQEGEPSVQKRTPDSFHETDLEKALKTWAIENLIVAGNQTEYCVDTTCRRAFSLGYTVTLVKDGHGTWDSDSLNAKQIIDHHNEVLSYFADVKNAKEVFG
ncbi:cysteine hydrolase family protein [Planococcus shenhongbingii]|uniref:cysteine hydrolase family protein n=1 Tax=Planococcus shenhongbingii TaxID=3058398 RepID=UPI00261062B0|nr:cysteine hydrolase family protein [Planococcus sp. N016]WKA56820.1 cysteine hydrolase family protein [Planococcus sp. N016]